MSIGATVWIQSDGHTIDDVKDFLTTCEQYKIPKTAELYDHPNMLYKVTNHPGPRILEDAYSLYQIMLEKAPTDILSPEDPTFMIDLPIVDISTIICGDHVPKRENNEYVEVNNILITVNPECATHE